MKAIKVQQNVTYFELFQGTTSIGVFSAYQLREGFTPTELDDYTIVEIDLNDYDYT